MHEKQFYGLIERLRAPERVARLELNRVIDLCLESGDFKTVLDVGVGSGLFAEAFSQRGMKVAGVDINPRMIHAARKFVPEGDFQEATAETLPYSDAAFDLVFMGLLLHESDEPIKVLREARRVTCKRLCILEWPYLEDEYGPPQAQRISHTQINDLAHQAGFVHLEKISLEYLILYRMAI